MELKIAPPRVPWAVAVFVASVWPAQWVVLRLDDLFGTAVMRPLLAPILGAGLAFGPAFWIAARDEKLRRALAVLYPRISMLRLFVGGTTAWGAGFALQTVMADAIGFWPTIGVTGIVIWAIYARGHELVELLLVQRARLKAGPVATTEPESGTRHAFNYRAWLRRWSGARWFLHGEARADFDEMLRELGRDAKALRKQGHSDAFIRRILRWQLVMSGVRLAWEGVKAIATVWSPSGERKSAD